jgi:hypothetical protein
VKPSGGSQGDGIVLVRHESKVPRYLVSAKPAVAQSCAAATCIFLFFGEILAPNRSVSRIGERARRTHDT